MADLSLTTRSGRDCVVVQVAGVLDLASTPQVQSCLQQTLDDGARTVVLDLSGVQFIDSTALGMIVWFYKQLLERGGRVSAVATRPMVLSVFQLTSVNRLVRVYDSVEAAERDMSADDGS